MDNIMLYGENLIKEYGKSYKVRALNDVSVSLYNGEFSSIIGTSGCGKSTLLNMLGALDKPTTGKLFFKGKEFSNMNENELAIFRNKHIGFIFQSHNILSEFTALENVMLPSWIETGKADKRKEKRAIELLETVGLKDKINNLGNNLSGGQQQRVSIARSLINNPNIVLADEPTGNLDSDSSDQVYELLRKINKDLGISFLIVTHDRHIAEKSDRVIEMKDGEIIKDYLTKDKSEDLLWKDLAPCHCKCINQNVYECNS